MFTQSHIICGSRSSHKPNPHRNLLQLATGLSNNDIAVYKSYISKFANPISDLKRDTQDLGES